MVRQGLFDEVRSLLLSGVSSEATSMQAIGYKEVVAALQGSISREDAVASIKQASRRYAKRQITWFRRHTDACRIWYDEPHPSLSPAEIALLSAKKFLENP